MPYQNLLLLACNLLATASLSAAQSIQHINPPGLPVSKNYSQVVVAQGSRTIYVSGQVSANEKGEIINKDDFTAQVKQVHENLKIALAAAGATVNDVVKVTAYVVNTDASKIGIVRDVRKLYFTSPNPPASTYVGVQGLYDKDVMVEIEAIAVLK